MPTAPWLIAENAKRGTLNWICNHNQPDHALEGFASQVSAVPGDDVAVFVSTTARAVQVQAYRMGYYQGLGGRLVVQTDFVPAKVQAAPVVTPGIGTVTCPWSPTLTLNITKDWLPGCYLLKLVGDGGEEQFVPLTIRDDASMASYVFQNSVTTWQAYNLWGSYSLYYGPDSAGRSDFASRARAVSFDRPYPQTWASGAADFVGNELPLLFHLESLGLDLTYWTDVDLHARPQLLMNHRCLFSLGHDEYWSQPMRQGAAAANASGVNLAFLGANACYRQIRLQPTSVGPNRLQVCYKDAAEDPLAHEQPALTTVNWNQAPVNNPESTLIGSMYQSVGAKADMVVTDASSWFYDGCNLTDGHTFRTVILGEYDRYVPVPPRPAQRRRAGALAGPGPVQLVRHHLLHRAGQRRAACWPAARPASCRCSGRPAPSRPTSSSRRHSRRDRRDPPRHGERLRPLRPGSGHLLRQLERQLVRRSTPAPPPARAPPPAPPPPDSSCRARARSACRRAGMTPLCGPHPRTIDAQRWPNPTPTAPGRGARSPGARWRPPASPGCS